MGTCMFSKIAIDYKVLWRSIKVVESTWGVTSYCWILGLSNFRYCGKPNWSKFFFPYCWYSNRTSKMLIWKSKLKSTCINFQELAKWSTFWLWSIVGIKSLDDFGDVEAKFLDQIKEEFEDQVDHYVKLVDTVAFDF